MSKLCSNYFNTSGSWTCPAGVTEVIVLAHGGGMGGSGGANITFNPSNAGNGTIPQLVSLPVVPNTSYSITIGAGGAGGAPRTSSVQNTNPGGSTTFGGLYTFQGAFGSANPSSIITAFAGLTLFRTGALGTAPLELKTSGLVSNTGTTGTDSGTYAGGYRGAEGYAGSVAGSGGNANSAGTGNNGTNASGFGSGGGSGGGGSTAGGSGGNGAPGQMWVIWVE